MHEEDEVADELDLTFITTPEEMQDALSVRSRVFVGEQRVPIEEEVDHYDADPGTNPTVVQILGRLDGKPVATARLMLDQHDGYPHIGRVAVLQELRGRGLGRQVMLALQEEARRRGYGGVTLAAQLQAMPFYEKLGYVSRGPVFLDAGIEHRDMDLRFGD